MPDQTPAAFPPAPGGALSVARRLASMRGMAPAEAPVRGAVPPLTILAVEDSRFASEAIRLMCRRWGARLRRAETIEVARRHLSLYRPDAVIVDLGLPDGRGETLIRDLAHGGARPDLVIAISGEPLARAAALAAGADAFVAKPFESLAAFERLFAAFVRAPAGQGQGQGQAGPPLPAPDPLALRDDLARAARLVEAGPEGEGRRYLCGFVKGLARHAEDAALADAARAAEGEGEGERGAGLDRLALLLSHRLAQGDGAFAQGRG